MQKTWSEFGGKINLVEMKMRTGREDDCFFASPQPPDFAERPSVNGQRILRAIERVIYPSFEAPTFKQDPEDVREAALVRKSYAYCRDPKLSLAAVSN